MRITSPTIIIKKKFGINSLFTDTGHHFAPFREDGELEDGEIDDEGIGIEEENKEATEVVDDKEKEKEKEKEKSKEREEKSHRHSRKRYKKTREKRHSKRRRRDRQKVSCNSTLSNYVARKHFFCNFFSPSPSSAPLPLQQLQLRQL